MKKILVLLGCLSALLFVVMGDSAPIAEIVKEEIASVETITAEPAPRIERSNPLNLVEVTVNIIGDKAQGLEKLRVILVNKNDIAKQFDFHDKPHHSYLLQMGEWQLDVTSKYYMTHTQQFVVTANTTEINVQLFGAAKIVGKVSDSFGNPVAREHLFFLTSEQQHPQLDDDYRKDMFYALSNDKGRFTSPPLPAGEYYISVGRPRSPGLRSLTAATLLEFERKSATVVVADKTLLRLIANGEMSKGIDLSLEELDERESRRNASSPNLERKQESEWDKAKRIKPSELSEEGEVLMTDLHPGRYRLVVEAGRQKYLFETPFDLQAGIPVTVRYDIPEIVQRVKPTQEERDEKRRLRAEQRELGIKPDRPPKYLPLVATITAPDFASNIMVPVGISWQ
ncbi:MAG: carboxypeptidase-like regulatory domain-containing protein [Planctomycetota bacterium]|jgi:hypothetical protein